MQGLGVRPVACAFTYGATTLLLELLGEVEDVMVDPQPARHTACVVDVAH